MKESWLGKELFTEGLSNIFCFGSNLSGFHSKGAAKFAKDFCGAIYRNGKGLQRNSYAIPTKDHKIKTLPLEEINNYVDEFILFAKSRQDLIFYVTKIGCGLAGFSESQISPMFKGVTENCKLPEGWRNVTPSK